MNAGESLEAIDTQDDPNADLRRIDLLDERGLNRQALTQLGTCSFVSRSKTSSSKGSPGRGSRLACLHDFLSRKAGRRGTAGRIG